MGHFSGVLEILNIFYGYVCITRGLHIELYNVYLHEDAFFFFFETEFAGK
jgi:hypothetical protein